MLMMQKNNVTTSDMIMYACLYAHKTVNASQFLYMHEANIPCSNFQSDHDKFIENQGSKRDRYDMEEFIIEKNERHDHDVRAFEKRYQRC